MLPRIFSLPAMGSSWLIFCSANLSYWPLTAAPVVRLRVRYRVHSCRAGSLIRRRVRREVADIEHGRLQPSRPFSVALPFVQRALQFPCPSCQKSAATYRSCNCRRMRLSSSQQNIWQLMRQNWLSNRIFKSFDDIVDHCCYAWTALNQPWKIMSIGRRDWAVVGQSMRGGIRPLCGQDFGCFLSFQISLQRASDR